MPLGNSQGILHPCEKLSLLPEIFDPEWSRAHGLKFLSSCAQLLWKESPLHRNEKSVFILQRMFLISAGNRHDFFSLFFFSLIHTPFEVNVASGFQVNKSEAVIVWFAGSGFEAIETYFPALQAGAFPSQSPAASSDPMVLRALTAGLCF